MIQIRNLCTKDIPQALDLITDAFLHRKEPTCYHLQNQNEDAFRFHTLCYLKQACDNHEALSYVAIDVSNNDRVVGISLNRDYTYKVPKDLKLKHAQIAMKHNQLNYFKLMIEEAKEIDKVFVNTIRSDIKNQISLSNLSGDIFYIYMVAVDSNYQRQGIVTKLVKSSIEKAKELNYKICYFQASNEWSKRCFIRNNFQIINKLNYRSWEFPKDSNKYPKAYVAEETGFDSIYTLILPLQKGLNLSFTTKAKL